MLDSLISQLEEYVTAQGWDINSIVDIPYGKKILVVYDSYHQIVNVYSTGKIAIQGKDTPMKTALENWANNNQGIKPNLNFSSDDSPLKLSPPSLDPQYLNYPGYLELFTFLYERNLGVESTSQIDYGIKITINDGKNTVIVNLYNTGSIVIGGKVSDLKQLLEIWKNSLTIPLPQGNNTLEQAGNRTAKYLVLPQNIFEMQRKLILEWGESAKEIKISAPAETYRIEINTGKNKVTISQYKSGALVLQGRSSTLFEEVCAFLDLHLIQSFSERAERYLPDGSSETVKSYLDQPAAENSATVWVNKKINKPEIVSEFLFPNDRNTLIAGAGLYLAAEQKLLLLPDYTPIIMPFAKAFEGYLVKLAIHLDLTSEENIQARLKEIKIGQDNGWIAEIKKRLPDSQRFGEIVTSLEAAWQCRHKVMHSDFAHPIQEFHSLDLAYSEINLILRAIERSYKVFVTSGIKLSVDISKPKPTENTTKKKTN